ncbi:MAG: hypothetical protein ACREXI_11925, partial [Caldimonas sp.]
LAVRRAAPLPPRVAGYARAALLPIGGGVTIPVPAGVGIALEARALNGTWLGRTVVNGPVGLQEEVLVKMRPIAGTGAAAEAITAPFDSTRALQTAETARFSFAGVAAQYARITVSRANASTLTGHVRLLQGATALGGADFGASAAVVVAALPADGSYGIEITGLANTPGAYRLQVELLGGLQAETVAFPLDVTQSLPAFTSYRASFDIAAPLAAHLAVKTDSQPMQVRLVGPDGSVLYAKAMAAGTNVETVALALPAAGRYRYEVASVNAAPAQFRITAEPTSWLAIAPTLDTDSSFSMLDLVADRNGRPVVGFLRSPIVNRQTTQSLLLRRWTGTAWETVGSDISIGTPCSSHDVASFAFDSTNAPVIVYASSTAGGGSFTTARRFSAGAWQPVGPNDGVLPNASAFSSSCSGAPKLVLDGADRPIVAYRADNLLWLQRYENNAWSGFAAPAGDSFGYIYGSFDLKLDANDVPWFVHSADNVTTVRRFDAGSHAWVAVGPNGGRLPETNTAGLGEPRLRFDAAGRPVIGTLASVGSVVTSQGVAVYRYDGSTWSTSGGYQTGPDSYVINTLVAGYTLADSDALMAWSNATRNVGAAVVVQRNTAAGWAAVGAGIGQIPQYTEHAITPNQYALDPRLLAIGSDIYLVLVTV